MRPWPRLTAVEGSALTHLERLLGVVGGPLPATAVRLPEPLRPAVAELGRRRMAASSLRYLLDGGGWRERTVLRATDRVSGRLWDRALNEGFTLRFSANARSFWLASARHLPSLTAAAVTIDRLGDQGIRQRRRAVRAMLPVEAVPAQPPTGDWILFALVQQQLPRLLGASDEAIAAVSRRLRLASPLASLMALTADDASDDELEARLRTLLAPGGVRVVECVEERLVASWTARIAEAHRLLRGEELPRLLARWQGIGRALHAWLRALDGERRLDLARGLLRLARELVTRLFVDGGVALRAAAAEVSGLRSMGERDQVVAAMATVVDLGPTLLRRRDELARERYGDARYAEAQLFVRDADAELASLRAPLLALSHDLSGIIA